MGSRSQSEDQSTFDPNYTPPNTVDFATQEVLATLAAAAEAGDQIASQEAGVTRADGKQQGSRKRLISLVDDTDDSDVEISQPTQKTKPRRQTSFGTATGKPIQMHLLLRLNDATGKLYKYDPSTKTVTILMEGLGGAAGCTVSSDGSFVLVSQFTKNNIKRYWIKGPKAGSSEDFSNSPSRLHPSSIRRIGSTGNFWIAAVQRVTNQTAVAKVDSNGKGFYTGVSGGTILKYTPEKGFVIFAHITKSSNSLLCYRLKEPISSKECGRPAGIAFNEKTGDLYVADALLGLHVVSPAGGLAVKIADGVDRNPIKFLNGLDVDPTTGIVYFTSLSSHFSAYQMHLLLRLKDATGKLYKYDPSTKTVTVLMEGLGGSAGCTVSSDGSFVLVSQFTKNNIKRYWIKGPKAGSFEDFSNSPSRPALPSSIRRVGSTGNFWIAAVQRVTNQTAVAKVDSNGEVIQRIYVPLLYNFLSEVNEFDGSLYFGSLTERYVGILKL
ncbi:hypothetical protein Bca52824_083082 [Brassica carinata]|uniref:Strictosidine synthase conserved region domain-containing protein n=1 Tax=Brassica carinata TaxID=52824 RepID=A0A8X7TTI5_BRACI|nr:hypothetical protein Bca52824_083082 [Brassica carinata]